MKELRSFLTWLVILALFASWLLTRYDVEHRGENSIFYEVGRNYNKIRKDIQSGFNDSLIDSSLTESDTVYVYEKKEEPEKEFTLDPDEEFTLDSDEEFTLDPDEEF